MKKSILHIQLMNRPPSRSCNTQHNLNCTLFNHRIESLIIINTRLLIKSSSNPTSLILGKSTISIVLQLSKPSPSNDINSWRTRNKTSDTVIHRCFELISHSSSPVGISKRTTIVTRNNRTNCRRSSQVLVTNKLYSTGLETSQASQWSK
jgi:hypothetical protein